MFTKKYLIFAIVFIVFWFKGILFLDPDFGWRLVGGGVFAQNGLPQKDIFSYTMPTFAWVDHAWSQSILINYLYTRFGQTGTSFLYMLLPLLSLFIVAQTLKDYLNDKDFFKNIGFIFGGRFFFSKFLHLSPQNFGFFAGFPFWLGASTFMIFSGVRVQLASWLLMAILYFILFAKGQYKKLRYYLPVFFLIWANLHGSFLSGLMALTVFILLKSYREKHILISDYLLILFSFLLTLVNPYGVGIWREVISSVTDSNLRSNIIEWMPAFFMFDLSIIFLMVVSFVFIFHYKSKFTLEEIGLFLLFSFQAIFTRRHLPLWSIFAVPVAVKGIYYLYQDAKRTKLSKERFNKVYKWAWIISIIFFVIDGNTAFSEALKLREGKYYPSEAVNYLSENIPKGEIFSDYGWGGYLIWKLPAKKVFVDGRMPSWRWKNPPEAELGSAFETYLGIINGEDDYIQVFNKFDIDTVLWSKNMKPGSYEKYIGRIENFLTRFGYEEQNYDLLENLENHGWNIGYEDQSSIVLLAPK